MNVALYIQNGETVFEPVVEGSITWELQRKEQPGKLSFTMLMDARLSVEEGNAVRLDVNGKPVFFGFLFIRSWPKDRRVKVTVYDQLRYLKNKDTYNYENLTAAELLRQIADDFHLQTGEIEDTVYRLSRAEKDKTLFDIILNALDATMMNTGNLFVLYDDVGKLALKNIADMKLSLMIDKETAQDYEYKVSIDGNTYNQIKLYYDNNDTGKREVYLSKDSENINKWGVLQMNESIQAGENGQQAAETYLSLYNHPERSLRITGAFGDIRVRAGCLIPVFLDVGEIVLKNYMLVEAVTHKIDKGFHSMDLTLRGAGINA